MMSRISDLERKYVSEVLDSGFRTSKGGEFMKRLEEAFANKFNCTNAVSFTNGTATMHACLEAWGIGIGDEVIVPPLTMSSTSFAVLQANAIPIFADVDPDTFNIDPNSIREKISEKTKAIITVSLYGLCPDYDEIKKVIGNRDIKLLEDNAECFLGYYKNKVVGSIGDASSFSFQSSKHLTAGEGGMVTTNNEDFAINLRRVQSLGYIGVGKNAKIKKSDIQDPSYFRHGSLGWNYRMPELCAAVALAQTERIEELVASRIRTAEIYADAITGYEKFITPQKSGPDYVNSYWTWVCKIYGPELWHDFKEHFMALGGQSFYSAWKLSYQEPFMRDPNLLGRESFIPNEVLDSYRTNLCPVAEDLQVRLMQFKTNFYDKSEADKQAEILNKTCSDIFGS